MTELPTGSVVLDLPTGPRVLSPADLAAIRAALRDALLAGASELQPLVPELDRAGIVIDDAGRALLGPWTLGVRDGVPTLVRQQMPRQPVMLFHVAPLAFEDGRWEVTGVHLQKVRGR